MKKLNSFERIETSSGVRWILPCRDTTNQSIFGWGALGIGVFSSLFMAFWIGTPITWGIDLLKQGQPFGWLFVAFSFLGFGGLFFAIRFLILGVGILRSQTRAEIELRRGKLLATEKLGWFDWCRKVKIKEIVSFELSDSFGPPMDGGSTTKQKHLGSANALLVKTGEDKKMLTCFYPLDMLEELANEIAGAIEEVQAGNSSITVASLLRQEVSTSDKVPIKVVSAEEVRDAIPELPESSRIQQLDKETGTVVWEIPPVGFKGSGFWFLALFSGFWLLISGSLFITFLISLLTGPFDAGVASGCGVGFLFVLIGLAILVAAVHYAKVHLLIGVVDDQLFIERKTIFGDRWTEFEREDLARIEVGDSNVEVNDKAVQELKIICRNGDSKGLMSSLKDSELEWMAYQLNQRLNLGFDELERSALWRRELRPLPENGVRDVELPAKSTLQINDGRQLEITIPRKGLWKGSGGLFFAFIMLVLPFLLGKYFLGLDGIIICFITVFVLIGLGSAISTIVYFLRSYTVLCDGRVLTVERNCVAGNKTMKWDREQIKRIDLVDSGGKLNNQTVWKLIVYGKPEFSFMNGWQAREIAIVAGYLTERLGLVEATMENNE